MDKIRVAFIGCGGMSSRLQQCIPLIPEFEFVATCDLIAERAEGNARKFGALRYYTDYDEMLKSEELDAVAVVGRPEDKLHRDIGIECLQRGYHIYTEKPPATTVEGAKMIVDAMKESGKTGMVGTMWRHAPAHRMAKQFMDDEENFGKPCQYQTRYLAPTPRIQSTESPFAWPFMLDQAIHPTDCMRFLMGPVSQVFALGATDDNGTLSISVNLSYESGAVGNMTLGIGPILETMVFVKGTNEQAIQVFDMRQLRRYNMPTWTGTGGGYADTPTEEWDIGTAFSGIGRPGYLGEMRHWAQSLLAGEQPEPSHEDAYQNMRVLKAISDSVEMGEAVFLGK